MSTLLAVSSNLINQIVLAEGFIGMAKKELYPINMYEPYQTVHYSDDESYLDRLVSMNMQPFKIKKDFALEFTEWYRRVVNRATMIIDEWEKKSGISHTCHPECNSCCYHSVEIYNYEIFAIITHLEIIGQKEILNSAIPIADFIEKRLIISSFNKDNCDEDDIIAYKMEYRSLQIPCLFLKDRKCLIYQVRPTCCLTYYSYGPYEDCDQMHVMPKYCINHGSIEDWVVKQIIGFLDYNRRKVPVNFDPFAINILPISIRDKIIGLAVNKM